MAEQEGQAIIRDGVRTGKTEVALCKLLQAFGYPVKMDMGLVEVCDGKYVAMPTMVYEEKTK